MEKVGNKEIIRVHGLLAQLGLVKDTEYKANLIKQYTGGRETSTKGLLINEYGELIQDLQGLVNNKRKPGDLQAARKRKLLLHYAHMMQWELATGKVDMQRVNDWCVKYGQYHKALNEHNTSELSHLLVQFEKAFQSFLKSV